MQDIATLLSDILSYMTAGWRSRSPSVRWLVRGVTVALVIGLVWVLWGTQVALPKITVSAPYNWLQPGSSADTVLKAQF